MSSNRKITFDTAPMRRAVVETALAVTEMARTLGQRPGMVSASFANVLADEVRRQRASAAEQDAERARALRVAEQWQVRCSNLDREAIARIAPGLAEAIESL
jgi:hypothetical protein